MEIVIKLSIGIRKTIKVNIELGFGNYYILYLWVHIKSWKNTPSKTHIVRTVLLLNYI